MLILTLTLFLAAPAGPLDDDFDVFDDKRLFGTIKVVAEDGDSVQIKTRSGTMLVSGLLKVRRFAYEMIPLSGVKDGTKIWVLGRKQDGSDLPLNGYPPHITAIATVVVGPFEPPKRTAKQRQLGVDWHQGVLKREERTPMLDRVELQVGAGRKIVIVKPQKDLKLKKGQKIVAIGPAAEVPEPPEGKKPLKVKGNVRAKRIDVTSKSVPAKELAALIGL